MPAVGSRLCARGVTADDAPGIPLIREEEPSASESCTCAVSVGMPFICSLLSKVEEPTGALLNPFPERLRSALRSSEVLMFRITMLIVGYPPYFSEEITVCFCEIRATERIPRLIVSACDLLMRGLCRMRPPYLWSRGDYEACKRGNGVRQWMFHIILQRCRPIGPGGLVCVRRLQHHHKCLTK